MQKIVDKENDTITYSTTVDDSCVFDAVDEKLASMDMKVLKKALKEDPGNEIIKKAIKTKKKREKQARKQAKRERDEREVMTGLAIFDGLFGKK